MTDKIIIEEKSIQKERVEEKRFKLSKTRDRLLNRVSTAKNFKTLLKADLDIIKKDKISMTNEELISWVENLINKYQELELKASVNLEKWKGDGCLEIQRYPNYFIVREPRKKENEKGGYSIDFISHNIPLDDVLMVVKALNCLKINVKISTRKFANIWCVENDITKNDDGKDLFDKEGFIFPLVSGCRPTYFRLYYAIKICAHFGCLQYYKNGAIRKIKDKFDVQTEFI